MDVDAAFTPQVAFQCIFASPQQGATSIAPFEHIGQSSARAPGVSEEKLSGSPSVRYWFTASQIFGLKSRDVSATDSCWFDAKGMTVEHGNSALTQTTFARYPAGLGERRNFAPDPATLRRKAR